MTDKKKDRETKPEDLNGIDEEFLKKGAEKVTDRDIVKFIDESDRIILKIEKSGPLGRFIEEVRLMISMVKDYWHGRYREVPYLTIAAVVFTLMYVLNPIDLIPDIIPGLGLLDDLALTVICGYWVEQDLLDYKAWKESRPDG